MTNETNPDESGSNAPPPPPPPSGGPPPPPPQSSSPPPSTTTPGKSDNTLMLILSYLGIFCLIPLFVEKEDREVNWHARNGTCLLIVAIITGVAIFIVNMILNVIPVIGTVIGCLLSLAHFLLWLGISIFAMVKATKGERYMIPLVSDYVDRIKV